MDLGTRVQFPPPPSFSVHPSTSDGMRLDTTNLPVPRGVMSFLGSLDSRQDATESDSMRPPALPKALPARYPRTSIWLPW